MAENIMLVGCGNMGFALLAAWTQEADASSRIITVIEPDAALRARAEAQGVAAYAAPEQARDSDPPDFVFLAVKPQIMAQVLPPYTYWAEGSTVFVSIAAGLSVATLRELLGGETPVIRCMPNTPAAIGAGMMVCYQGPLVSEASYATAQALLAACGTVASIEDESLMDAVTAVSGSGPAYVFHFIEALAHAAEQQGLPAALAKTLATQTVYGAGKLASDSEKPASQLREEVTSPGGTTAAALATMMSEDRLAELVATAVEAAAQRSRELA